MTADAVWPQLLMGFASVFTAPSLPLFINLATGRVLCPGRRTITRIYRLAEPRSERAHDAYYRFFRIGAWSMRRLWKQLVEMLVNRFCPTGAVRAGCAVRN